MSRTKGFSRCGVQQTAHGKIRCVIFNLQSRALLLGRGRSVPVWKGTTGSANFRNHFPNHWSLGGINGGNANRADLGDACRHWFHADDMDVSVAQTFRSHTFALWNLVRHAIDRKSFLASFRGRLVYRPVCFFWKRNHALYNFLAQGFLLLLLYLNCDRVPLSRGAIWLTGLAIGSVPIIAMFLCIPGFAQSYVESIQSILQRGTNLGLPVPWPWQTALTGDFASIEQFVLGILFVALPIFFIVTLCSCLFLRYEALNQHALFVACVPIGLFYMHHAFSRTDLSHLVQSIHPFTLATVAFRSFQRTQTIPSYDIAVWIGLGLFVLATQPVFQRWNSQEP